MLRALGRVGHDERDRLAGVVHVVVLHREEALARRRRADQRGKQVGTAATGAGSVGEDGEDAVRRAGRARVSMPVTRPLAMVAPTMAACAMSGGTIVRRVARGAGDLGPAVHPVDRPCPTALTGAPRPGCR